jgi:hypothetical protein
MSDKVLPTDADVKKIQFEYSVLWSLQGSLSLLNFESTGLPTSVGQPAQVGSLLVAIVTWEGYNVKNGKYFKHKESHKWHNYDMESSF